MESIYVLTEEWFDIIYIDNNKKEIIRKLNKDNGTFLKEDNKLNIIWKKWGIEKFVNYDQIYYQLDENNNIKIYLENEDFIDYAILNPIKKHIYLENYKNKKGNYIFQDQNLIIEWEHTNNIETYYSMNHGRYFSNIQNIQNNPNKDLKDIKNIAIFFPQYHEFEENNQFWGKGFTEWTLLKNIPKKVNEQIIKQPYEDIGYYNLNDIEHRKYIESLATHYHIHGFCFYHYWFKNKKVMYEPLELMLKDNKPNVKFMFCWANEQWTKRWDGGNNEILIEQDYSDKQGNEEHFYYLLDFFNHKNYIKIENKPVFIFYRIEEKDVSKIEDIIILWNNLAKNNKFSGIYFMRFIGPFNNSIQIKGINSYINFEPGNICQNYYNDISNYDEKNTIFKNEIYNEEAYLAKNKDIQEFVIQNKYKSGEEHYNLIKDHKEGKNRISKFFVFDGQKSFEKIIEQPKKYEEQHFGIFSGWNNTPRRNFTSNDYSSYPHYYKNIDVNNFGDTYLSLLKKINQKPNRKIDFLFISAWNEWNEQAMLEPNNIDGYNYLNKINEKYIEFYDKTYQKVVLNFSHKGGGTEKYMNDIKKLFPLYKFIDVNISDLSLLENLEKKYSNIKIDFIHINSLYNSDIISDYHIYFYQYFKSIKKIITIHDYQWLYPNNPNILSYLFNPDNIQIEQIYNLNYLFSISTYIIFPSYNILKNYNLVLNMGNYNDKLKVIYHNDLINYHDNLHIPKINNIINISYIGHFINHKGSDIFKKLFNNYQKYKNYEIHYHVFGYLSNEEEKNMIKCENFKYYNDYDDNNIQLLLNKYQIHGITHLSLFEESYCYSLTQSINSGRAIIYLNHGAFTERLKNQERYFPTDLTDINKNYELFLDFIIDKQNIEECIKLNEIIQPQKWYLMNYK